VASDLDDDAKDILLGARLTQWSPAAGRTVQRSGLRDTGGIFLVSVKRAATGNIHHAVGPEFVLQVGDILYFTGLIESFGDFCSEAGLEVVTNEIDGEFVQQDSESKENGKYPIGICTGPVPLFFNPLTKSLLLFHKPFSLHFS